MAPTAPRTVTETLLDRAFPRSGMTGWQVRDALDSLWRDVPREALPVARLLAGEIAVTAAEGGGDGELEFLVTRADATLRVEVRDRERDFASAGAAHGRDLELVKMLAERWGISGTRFWFELPAA